MNGATMTARLLLPLALTLCACGNADPAPTPDAGDAGPSLDPRCFQIFIADDAPAAIAHAAACLDSPPEALDEDTRRQAVLRLRERLDALGGLPVVDGDAVTFVYVDHPAWDEEDDRRTGENYDPTRRRPPVRLTGPFVDWDPDAGPELEVRAPGLYAAAVPASAVAGRGYRFVARDNAGAAIAFSDPQSRRYDFDRDGRRSLVRGDAERGHLEQLGPVPAEALGRPRKVAVWLPPGYEQSAARYPVLYMHDGNNLFDRDQPRAPTAGPWDVDGVMEQQLAGGHVRPGIIVGVPNSDARLEEYTHVPDDVGGGPVGGEADGYLDMLVNEVKPWVDARYRTLSDKASTGVLGSSLGGLVSFYAGLRYPQVFGFVGGMSSTFGWGRFGLDGPSMLDLYRDAEDLAAQDQVFYLDSGGGPAPACPEGEDNYCELVEMRDLLRAAGVRTEPPDLDASPLPEGVNLMWVWAEGAAHNEANWRVRVHRPLRLFLRP